MSNPLLDDLTDAQREAVEHLEGPLLILAGPGSGKTRVITHRIANLLRHGVPARNIAALTFTNKAADEMRARVERLAPGEGVWMSTFHRFCARLLRQYASFVGLAENFTIYDTDDSGRALKATIESLGIDLGRFAPERVASTISWAKNHVVTPDAFATGGRSPLESLTARIYPAYQAQLAASNAADFDDLLMHVAVLLRDNPEVRSQLDRRFRYILVDEYQDTNRSQYMIVRALSLDYPNLAVTGDPDQSIYGWRGANLANILDFESAFGTARIVKLEQNWRSTQHILQVADALIVHNVRRKPKRLFTENALGQPVRLVAYGTNQAEAAGIAERIAGEVRAGRRRLSDFAIFYRMNALSRELEHALREQGVPYQMVNGLEFYQRKEIKDVLAYLRLLNNPRDSVAFTRTVNTPPRGIGKATIDRLAAHALRRGLSLLDAAREAGVAEGVNKRAAVAVAKFVAMFDRLSLLAAAPVEEILGHVLSESGYADYLKDTGDEEDQERLANIQELLSAARQFDERHPERDQLEAFLEEASLTSDTDAWQADTDRVTLMTLHASKGLEFPVVFIVATEGGILPHERSHDNPDALEEERRLLFVGITRAREELQLSRAIYRDFRGQRRMAVASSFLLELPREAMEIIEPGRAQAWSASAGSGDAHDEYAQHLDDFEFPPAQVAPAGGAVAAAIAPLATAADLHPEEEAPASVRPMSPAVSPDAFTVDMVVKHPEYGLGKIVALSGTGQRRAATVAFASEAGQKKFMLIHSQLQPAGGGNAERGTRSTDR